MEGGETVAKPLDVDAESFREEVLGAEGPVQVDFWSPTCPTACG